MWDIGTSSRSFASKDKDSSYYRLIESLVENKLGNFQLHSVDVYFQPNVKAEDNEFVAPLRSRSSIGDGIIVYDIVYPISKGNCFSHFKTFFILFYDYFFYNAL